MAWLILAIAAWGLVHSWLASTGFKAAARRLLGESFRRWYRLAYNAFSVVSFLPILLLVGYLPDRIVYIVPAPWRYAMLAAQLLALLGLLVAIRQTDAWALLGLKQLAGGEEDRGLVTGGFYRYMRHPMYFFGLLALWLMPAMTRNMLVAALGLTAYLLVGAYFEERKLARTFGPAYAEYKARTPMILPLPVRSREKNPLRVDK